MIELKRTNFLTRLDEMSKSGSLLVVGGPGTGKSWLLQQFAAQRLGAGDAVLLLLAEDHNYINSIRELEESLRIPVDIVSSLRAFSGDRRILIIDSLDALRAEASQRVFRQLIRQVHRELPGWVVVASIRSFDAKESLELQNLFPQTVESCDLDGVIARHIEVPLFSDSELEETIQQDNRLAPVFSASSGQLREMLRNAFNLWLVIRLLNENVTIDWLYEIESEVQLFEWYWRYRISNRADCHDRIRILTDVTSTMVESRTLSVPFSDSYKAVGASITFQSLLSDEVLRKTQTLRVAFTHNILFDFAVAKLLLDEHRLFKFLNNPERSIFFRPSLSYFLASLWYGDRDLLWNLTPLFFKTQSKLPARVTVVPGITIFHSATNGKDLTGLLGISGGEGIQAVLSVLRAVQAFDGINSRRAPVWLDLLYRLSRRLDRKFLNEFLALLEIASRQGSWSPNEWRRIALASVRLLSWMWNEAESDRQMATADQLLSVAAGRVIPLVTRLFPVDPHRIRRILQKVLRRIGRPNVSASEAYSIANCLETVIDVDPAFAVDVYASIFAHKEQSKEMTTVGGGRVMVLTSTRAQDYSMAYYVLGVKFPHFLKKDLHSAALAAVRSVAAEVLREHTDTARKIGGYSTTFHIAGIESSLTADRSDIWDQGYRNSESLQIFDVLLNHLVEALKNGELKHSSAWSLFKLITTENRFPVIWKRVLEHASHSHELQPFVLPLMQCPEILAAPEITVLAGQLIGQSFKTFPEDVRQSIESAIWAMPSTVVAKIYRDPNAQRNRLLACIPEDLQSEASKKTIQKARSEATLLDNRPRLKIGPIYQGKETDDEWLTEIGVDPTTAPNRTLLDSKRALAAFQVKYLNQTPSIEETTAILSVLQDVYEQVKIAVGADQRVITDVFSTVVAVAASILKNAELPPGGAAVCLSRKILASGARYPFPHVSKKAGRDFDHANWGSTPKTEAAQGLVNYILNWGLDAELKRLMKALTRDQSPEVRYHIAAGLTVVYKHDPGLFWKIASSTLLKEEAIGVLLGLTKSIGHPFIGNREPEKVVHCFHRLLQRHLPKQRSGDVLDVVADTLTQIYVYLGRDSAAKELRLFEKAPLRYAQQLQIMNHAASYFLSDKIGTSDLKSCKTRVRAREVVLRVLAAADKEFHTLEQHSRASKRGYAKRTELVKHLLLVADRLVFRLYILIGANPELDHPEKESLSESCLGVFFEESQVLWNALVGVDSHHRRPVMPSTAHHLMQCFNRLLPCDPARVLKLAARLITGRTFGYQFDEFAIHEFVKFTDKMLADHKDILREAENTKHFAEILDVFVSAGWPEATRLVMRLDAALC